jgi:hypothetical protein
MKTSEFLNSNKIDLSVGACYPEFMKFYLAALALVMIIPAHAFADGWQPKLTCENGGFVIDEWIGAAADPATGAQPFSNQIVIRDSAAVEHFTALVQASETVPVAAPQVNSKGEIILACQLGGNYDAFNIELARVSADARDANNNYVFTLHGKTFEGNRYDAEVYRSQVYPGMTPKAPVYLGNWIFNDCQ